MVGCQLQNQLWLSLLSQSLRFGTFAQVSRSFIFWSEYSFPTFSLWENRVMCLIRHLRESFDFVCGKLYFAFLIRVSYTVEWFLLGFFAQVYWSSTSSGLYESLHSFTALFHLLRLVLSWFRLVVSNSCWLTEPTIYLQRAEQVLRRQSRETSDSIFFFQYPNPQH